MNVYLVGSGSFPNGMAGAKRTMCYAKGLIAYGDSCHVICTHRLEKMTDDNNLPNSGVYNDVIFTYPSGRIKHKNKLFRKLDWVILDSIRTFFYGLRVFSANDIVFMSERQLSMLSAVMLSAKIKRAKVVWELCEHPMAVGNQNSKWEHFTRWIDRLFVEPHYDGIVAISQSLRHYAEKHKKKNAKVQIIPILVEDNFTEVNFPQESPYKIPYIIHTGTMLEQKDSISKILNGFCRFKKKYAIECKLVFTGPHANDKCPYLTDIRNLSLEEDVELLGFVSAEEIKRLQQNAAMTIIYKSDNLQTRNCFPTKLGEMLISAIPVITTNVGDANLYLENGKSAFIVKENDYEALADCIEFILEHPDRAREIGDAGRNVALHAFDPIENGKKLHSFFSSFC